ncbi:lipopolysaccharide transport system permease protein [Ectopseudomonas guguanensis]|uniref:Transport permease protein n=2 Tax=Ectopseudomonas guguanensis TaxID=1198456 RepID=A0A1H0TPA7_9GAMM|nr:lipopolysaccharide transport system permease protein [Pseudomonas guguanensis]
MRLGDMSGAAAILNQARQRYAKHASVWLTSAEWARLMHDRDQEQEYLAQGLANCPGHWEILFRSADLQIRLGNLIQAQIFNEGARAADEQRIEPQIQHAELAEKCEDWPEAEARWQQLLQKKPDYRQAYTRLSTVFTRQSRHQEARRYRLAGQYGAELLEPVPQTGAQNRSRGAAGKLHFAQLILTKALLGLKSETSRTHLNYAWVVIEPLLHLIIYYVLFSQLLNAGIQNYGLFLLCGLVPWMWFAKAISTSATSILGGQSLMLTTNIAPMFFPLVSVAQATLKQLPALLCLLALGLATDIKTLSWSLLWLPLVLLVQLLLTVALALLIAAIVPFLRDLANLVGTGLMLLMFLSGVIYDYRSMPGRIAQWLEYNPMAVVISTYRQIILEGNPPDFAGLGFVLMVAMVLLLSGAALYRSLRHKFVRQGLR